MANHDPTAIPQRVRDDTARFPHPFVDPWQYDHGYPLPYGHCGEKEMAASALWFGYSLKNVYELAAMRLSIAIRSKPDWRRKVHDDAIVARWRSESVTDDSNLTDAIFDYVLAEVRHLSKQENAVAREVVDGVWRRTDIDCAAFAKGVATLERDCDKSGKDWHPGSDQRAWDIVHPSLYPLVRGVSRVLPDDHNSTVRDGGICALLAEIGRGNVITDLSVPYASNDTDAMDAKKYRSEKFQWLPADVSVDQNGRVRFLSYVNNLHPEIYASVYAELEGVLGRMVPLFERVLSDLLHPLRRPISVRLREHEHAYDSDGEQIEPDEASRTPEIRVGEFRAHEPRAYSLRGRRLQVIVKIASIELTPSKPMYGGGVWHVEGCDNERIVASGILYYAEDNISDSFLGMRQAVNSPLEYVQFDEAAVERVFGIEDTDPLHQELGKVRTCAGKCIAFPNVFQHRVSRFHLADRRRNGHRKIVAVFLVDPTQAVISTSRVPPQGKEWLVREIERGSNLKLSLPSDVIDKIVDEMEFPLSREKAEAVRLELMNERKFIVDEHSKVFEREVSLCEH